MLVKFPIGIYHNSAFLSWGFITKYILHISCLQDLSEPYLVAEFFSHGYVLTVLILGATILQGTMFQNNLFLCVRQGIRLKGALQVRAVENISFNLTHCGLVMPYGDRSGSTLAQVMACCLTAPSHCLNQYWLIISKVQWHSSECNFRRDTSAISHWNQLQNYLPKILFKSPRGQWVNPSFFRKR